MSEHRRADPHTTVRCSAQQWPEWIFAIEHLNQGTEKIIRSKRVVLLDSEAWADDYEEGVAHCAAHLELEHHKRRGKITAQDERDAAELAELWLDETKGIALITGVNSI